MEQVGGEDGWSEETQEDETAHCCVTDVLVHCVEKKEQSPRYGSIPAVRSRTHEEYSLFPVKYGIIPYLYHNFI